MYWVTDSPRPVLRILIYWESRVINTPKQFCWQPNVRAWKFCQPCIHCGFWLLYRLKICYWIDLTKMLAFIFQHGQAWWLDSMIGATKSTPIRSSWRYTNQPPKHTELLLMACHTKAMMLCHTKAPSCSLRVNLHANEMQDCLVLPRGILSP